jgi:hypothetical protein
VRLTHVQLLEGGQQRLGHLCCARDVHHAGEGVIGGLPLVDVVVGVDLVRFEAGEGARSGAGVCRNRPLGGLQIVLLRHQTAGLMLRASAFSRLPLPHASARMRVPRPRAPSSSPACLPGSRSRGWR